MPRIGDHNYTFAEVNYGGLNRGILIIIEGIGAPNNTCRYRLGHNYNPHRLDPNWYANHFQDFYRMLGESVANRLENAVDNWNAQIPWAHATHARIHGIGYVAIREDLYF